MRYPTISSYKNKIIDGKKLCRNCNQPVPKGFRNYCSHKCRYEFTQDHWWPIIRETILKRDNHTCNICKKRKPKRLLDIDHIIPVKQKIDVFNKNNLRVLCRECHKAKTKMDNETYIEITLKTDNTQTLLNK